MGAKVSIPNILGFRIVGTSIEICFGFSKCLESVFNHIFVFFGLFGSFGFWEILNFGFFPAGLPGRWEIIKGPFLKRFR